MKTLFIQVDINVSRCSPSSLFAALAAGSKQKRDMPPFPLCLIISVSIFLHKSPILVQGGEVVATNNPGKLDGEMADAGKQKYYFYRRRRGLVVWALGKSSRGPGFKSSSLQLDRSVFGCPEFNSTTLCI